MIKALFCLLMLVVCGFATSLKAQEEPIAQAVAESPSKGKGESTGLPKARPITVAVSLVDDATTITGTLTETTSLSIKTAFGLAELPLNEVAGVRFPRGDDSSTTVVMLNGDSITGATDLKFVNVETSWGSAKVNGQSIASMMLVPGLAWQSIEVLSSKRWQLIEAPRSSTGSVGSPVPSAPRSSGTNSSSTVPALGSPAGSTSSGSLPNLPVPRSSSSGLPPSSSTPPRTGN